MIVDNQAIDIFMDLSRFNFTFSLFNTKNTNNNDSDSSQDDSTSTEENGNNKDVLVETIGTFGIYHITVCSSVYLANIPTGWVQLAIIFFAPPTKFMCISPTNITDACSKECLTVEYDRSIFIETIVTEWDLICDRAYLTDLSQAIVMFGILFGSIFFSLWSDRKGRRLTFVSSGLILLTSSLITSFVHTFWQFCLLRFVTAFALGGLIETSAEVIEDIIEDDKREAAEILSQIPFTMGHGSLPLCAYFVRHWRYFNFIFSAFCIIYVFYTFLFPESPRWLFEQGNIEKAIRNIKRAAKCNRKHIDRIRERVILSYSQIPNRAITRTVTTADLFRSSDLRNNTLIMCSEWFCICFVYFGVSQYIAFLQGNIFINVAIGAWLTLPCTSACVPLSKRLGRKCLLICTTATTGISLLIFALITLTGSIKLMMLTVGLLTSCMTMPQVHLYGGEVFPRYIRHEGVRACFVMGRLGAMLSPFVVDWRAADFMLPALILGIFSLTISFLCFLMPSVKILSTTRRNNGESTGDIESIESVKSIEHTDSVESTESFKSNDTVNNDGNAKSMKKFKAKGK
ncbi:solute carrier family 22 member 20-like [Teleopsis dalmanni]|uniref:solute carrier family 22 member 20-like n=1 Tax=Teleopsis dalmanni TaxID=139649 RepID=UPI0018CE92F7|nr:solute carrier family 22 member 20-like [Teleopsis dalmanni]